MERLACNGSRLCADGRHDPAEQQACAGLAYQLKQLQGDAFMLSAAGSPAPELEETDDMTLIYSSFNAAGGQP